MALQLGTIKSIQGMVIAKSSDGSQRLLTVGDIVYDNDVIITAEFATVDIAMANGNIVSIEPTSQYTVAANPNAANDDVEAIQQAILAGEDPTLTQDPTAAGAENAGDNEGVGIVKVDHLAPEVTPTSGFDTTGINIAFPELLLDTGEDNPSQPSDNTTPSEPVIGNPSVGENPIILFDDDVLGGNPGGRGDNSPDSLNTTGVLAHDYGPNGAGTLGFTDAGAPAGFEYVISDGGNVLTIVQNGTPVLELSLDDNVSGQYTVTQLAPIQHEPGSNENNQLFDVTYQVTDSDGDTANGRVTLNIDDDTPVVQSSDNPTIRLDDDALGGNPGGRGDNPDSQNTTGTLAHSYGADGEGSVLLLDTGAPAGFVYSLNSEGTVLTVSQDGTDVLQFSLTDTTSGDYTVTQLAPITHADGRNENNQAFRVNYQVTDSDGDTANGRVTLNIDDDTPVVQSSDNPTIRLDDDALGGNPGGRGDNPDSQNTTGTLAHSYGADGEGSVLLLDTGAPAGFVYSLNSEGTVLTVSQDGTDVLQFSLTDTTSGDYTVTQLAPITHADGRNENNQAFRVNYQVTDSDGDTANGRVTLNIDDDTPVITLSDTGVNDIAYSFTVTNHDEVSSAGYNSSYGYYIKDADGNPTTGVVVWDNVKDADATSITISGQFTPEQVGFFIIPNGDSRNINLEDNTEVTFQFVNGQWQAFDAGNPVIGDGALVLFDNANLNKDNENHVEDNALTGNQNWEDLPIVSGDGDFNDVNVNVEWTAVSITGDAVDTTSFGADGAGSIDFTLDDVNINGTLTSNGQLVTFEAKDTDADGHNDQIIGSTDDGIVLSIDGILDSNEFDLELFAPLETDHSGTDDVQITANINMTDSDGDTALATLNFNLDVARATEAAPTADSFS